MLRKLLFVLCLFVAAPASAQTLDSGPITSSPWEDYQRAVDMFNEGDRLRAGCVFYRGQFRGRLWVAAGYNRQEASALVASLQESVGRPINEWLGGDRDDWIAAMTCARNWAAQNDDPDLPRRRYAQAYAETLAGLDGLIAGIPPAAELRRIRTANGLTNR